MVYDVHASHFLDRNVGNEEQKYNRKERLLVEGRERKEKDEVTI